MLPYLFVLLAIAVRFLPFAGPLNVLPHAWHFTPLAASLLFFGARGSRRQLWVPLVLFAATDVILTQVHILLRVLLGPPRYVGVVRRHSVARHELREKSGFWRVVGAAPASSVSFFVISNFAVWAAWPDMYPTYVGRPDDVLHGGDSVLPRNSAKATCSSRSRCSAHQCCCMLCRDG